MCTDFLDALVSQFSIAVLTSRKFDARLSLFNFNGEITARWAYKNSLDVLFIQEHNGDRAKVSEWKALCREAGTVSYMEYIMTPLDQAEEQQH